MLKFVTFLSCLEACTFYGLKVSHEFGASKKLGTSIYFYMDNFLEKKQECINLC
jgi:hypothetical protein